MKLNKQSKWTSAAILLTLAGLLWSGCGAIDRGRGESKVYRVGLLSGGDIFNTAIDGFKAEMAELDYIEGENIVFDFQAAGGDAERMRQISEQFVADGVDLIFTTTNNAALAARAATEGTGVAVVFTFVIAPVKTGVVDDLRQPGGNLTGVRNPLENFVGKRVEFLLRMDPDVRRIWAPYNPQYPTVEAVLDQLRQDAPSLGVELIETPVSTPSDVIAELEARADANDIGFDAILIFPDLTVQLPDSWEAILALADDHNLAIAANTPGQVYQGALFSYLSDNVETGRQAAPLADKILRGSHPSAIPIASSEPRLIINYQVAESLGLTIGEGLLAQAAEVIR